MNIICVQCKKEFAFSEDEAKYYASKGLSNPKRCKVCRNLNKNDNLQIICIQCGKAFSFPKRERDFYRKKGYKAPKKCPICRGTGNLGLKNNSYFDGIQTYGPNINVRGGLVNSPGYKLEKMNNAEMEFSSEYTGKKTTYSHTINRNDK